MSRNMIIDASPRSPGLLGFSPLLDLNRDVARLFEELLQAPARAGPDELTSAARPTVMTPRINVAETEGALRVTAELPGVDLDDLEVYVADDILMIRGEKSIERNNSPKSGSRCSPAPRHNDSRSNRRKKGTRERSTELSHGPDSLVYVS